MKLINVTIHKYKSYDKKQSFPIDPAVTILVGKNESGKTGVLECIAKSNYFNDDEDFKFNPTHDYPRKEKRQYDKEGKPVKAITCSYELQDNELKEIEKVIGKDTLKDKTLDWSIKYDNSGIINYPTLNMDSFFKFIANKFKLNLEHEKLLIGLTDKESILNLEDSFQKLYNTEDKELMKLIQAVEELKGYFVNLKWENWLAAYLWINYYKPNIPKFMYFDEYYELPSQIELDKLTKSTAITQDLKTAKSLLELAEIDVQELLSNKLSYEDFTAILESTSIQITEHIKKYWKNNTGIRVEFRMEGNHTLHIRIFNEKYQVSLPLANRSKGFNWFFSFIVWFSKIQEDENNQYILLLDEPGLNLHASAQADLLEFLEDLSKQYQIIYTTHSPFMVPHDNLHRVRTVYESKDGTTIKDAIEEKDSETLFPLQAALGYNIAQNLFINKNNLLVEGVSDLVFLTMMSAILEEQKRECLNEKITIIPVGGLDKVTSFISLLRGQNLNIVCALDSFTNQKGKDRLQSLVTQKIIREQNILFFDKFSRPIDGDIADLEDLFSIDEYLKFFNGEFKEFKDISIDQIEPSKPIIKQINEIIGKERYTHYRPANFASALGLTCADLSKDTLDRFEKLFNAINSKIK